MGLDMNFYSVPKGFDIEASKSQDDFIFHSFRNHSDLHMWLLEQWLKKNPDKTKDDFNCRFYKITRGTLSKIKKLCLAKKHKHYDNCYWGHSIDQDWEETKQLCEEIDIRLSNNEDVYYYSWW